MELHHYERRNEGHHHGVAIYRWHLRPPATRTGLANYYSAQVQAERALEPSGDVCDGCGTTVDVTPLDQLGSFCNRCRRPVEVE